MRWLYIPRFIRLFPPSALLKLARALPPHSFFHHLGDSLISIFCFHVQFTFINTHWSTSHLIVFHCSSSRVSLWFFTFLISIWSIASQSMPFSSSPTALDLKKSEPFFQFSHELVLILMMAHFRANLSLCPRYTQSLIISCRAVAATTPSNWSDHIKMMRGVYTRTPTIYFSKPR